MNLWQLPIFNSRENYGLVQDTLALSVPIQGGIILVTSFLSMQSYINASLPLARRYIAKHFQGRLDKTIKKIRHV